MTTFTATYSPDDNKLRLYASTRLDPELYARVRAAGFIWAPKQDLFVAPMWTPAREDLLIELAGEVDDEDKSLCERAEERAERFDDYSDKRATDAQRARDAVSRIADGIPLGQPILIGHHSEKHARRDAAKIENGMRRAVKMWETSAYWTGRAAGALAHAKYKELPAVRARRIKTIEADKRKLLRTIDQYARWVAAWSIPDLTMESALRIANGCGVSRCFTLADFPRDPPASQYEGQMSLWSALDGGVINAQQAAMIATRVLTRSEEHRGRWLAHYDNRLAYERAMLQEQGAADLLAKKPRPKQLPLCNYRAPGGITCANPWKRGESIYYPQVDMTQTEYSKIYTDYKSTRIVGNSHRVRTAMIKHSLVSVFLTDSKIHAIPEAIEPTPREPKAPAPVREYVAPVRTEFDDMRDSLKAGVQVVAAPQLFPTPRELAERMIAEADIQPGDRVLEPSAGTGNLLGAMGGQMFAHNPDRGEVVAVEINGALATKLRRDFPLTDVRCTDFLECNGDLGTFDRIVMNPPFTDGADVAHVSHALHMLRPGGRLVAIMSAAVAFRDDRRTREFRNMVLGSIGGSIEPLPDDSFKESGTSVRTVLVTVGGQV